MPSAPEETSANHLQHIVVIWVVLFGVLVGAFAMSVLILNSSFYSAGNFVSSYLQALQRGDLEEVFATPGVIKNAGMSTELLRSNALGGLDDFTITSDNDQGGGIHLVSYRATLGGQSAAGAFQVIEGDSHFGIFSGWAFLQSPISELRVTPLHDASFEVNGIALTSPNGPSVDTSYQVLTPGVFTVTHNSEYLIAEPKTVIVTRPASTVPAVLDIQASPKFVSGIQKEVNDFLDECTQQEVLFPTGCPFGQSISNYVESVPTWRMENYPAVTIEPGNDPGTWLVPEAAADAHLTVDVRSLYDGSISVFDEDIPFAVSWVMTINNGRIDIQQQ